MTVIQLTQRQKAKKECLLGTETVIDSMSELVIFPETYFLFGEMRLVRSKASLVFRFYTKLDTNGLNLSTSRWWACWLSCSHKTSENHEMAD